MTESIFDDQAMPEISITTYEKLAKWRQQLDQTPKLNKRNVFERAADDLFLEREFERDLGTCQAIVDAIYFLGRDHAALDDDSIQFVMVGAQGKVERLSNGHANSVTAMSAGEFGDSEKPAESKTKNSNALVAFPLQSFEKIRLDTERRGYLVKGLIARSGLAVIWGPPKCGKSFWAADLVMHIALGWDYHGHKVQQTPVVYVALEGRHGFPARVEAFRRHHGVDVAPFYLLSASLDLVAKSGQLIASIKAQLGADLPGVLFLDTLNRSLVGSESKDEDMARFLAAAEKVAQELNCAVVIVHHCEIDASRPRGHTSLSGAAESQLKVERGNTDEIVVTVELAKDFAEGTEIVSRLERINLGADADGDPITSLVVLPSEGSPTRRAITRKLSDRQRLALTALDECAASSGKPAPVNLELPTGIIVVQLSIWRDELYRQGVLDRDAKSPREEFKRVRNSLHARGLIGVNGDLVWKA
jgi:AAA domain